MKVETLAIAKILSIAVMLTLWPFVGAQAEIQAGINNAPLKFSSGAEEKPVQSDTKVQAAEPPEVKEQKAPQLQGVAARAAGYRLGAGDILSIRVYGEEDMSREKFRLPDSGRISYPFGDVVALGVTVGELEKKIADGLRGRFLLNPRVSVSIEEYRQFFIYGQVERPGGYAFQPGLNVRKAVSIAGGFRPRASLEKIFIVREGDAENAAAKVDLSSSVWPGDTVTIEESFF